MRRPMVFFRKVLLEQTCSSKNNIFSISKAAQWCITLKPEWLKRLYISYLMLRNMTLKCHNLFKTFFCRISYFMSLIKKMVAQNQLPHLKHILKKQFLMKLFVSLKKLQFKNTYKYKFSYP